MRSISGCLAALRSLEGFGDGCFRGLFGGFFLHDLEFGYDVEVVGEDGSPYGQFAVRMDFFPELPLTKDVREDGDPGLRGSAPFESGP